MKSISSSLIYIATEIRLELIPFHSQLEVA